MDIRNPTYISKASVATETENREEEEKANRSPLMQETLYRVSHIKDSRQKEKISGEKTNPSAERLDTAHSAARNVKLTIALQSARRLVQLALSLQSARALVDLAVALESAAGLIQLAFAGESARRDV